MTRFHGMAGGVALLVFSACTGPAAPAYDLVIANGRVMDPESGLDAVRHIGVRGGKVEAVSESPLQGSRVIDASSNTFRARLALPNPDHSLPSGLRCKVDFGS